MLSLSLSRLTGTQHACLSLLVGMIPPRPCITPLPMIVPLMPVICTSKEGVKGKGGLW